MSELFSFLKKHESEMVWPLWFMVVFDIYKSEQFNTKWWIELALVIAVVVARAVPALVTKFNWRKRLGIVHVYPRRAACRSAITEAYARSKTARIFIIRGRDDFIGDGSLFYYASTYREKYADSIRLKNDEGGWVRVLFASRGSPMFSEERYKILREQHKMSKRSTDESKRQVSQVEDELKRIKEFIKTLEYRKHNQPFLAKFYLFDDRGFVIFNEWYSKIDLLAPVIEIRKPRAQDPDQSRGLYGALELYFDDVWNFYAEIKRPPRATDVSERV